MSINGHNTGSFDQAPPNAIGVKPPHDFLGSPVHDRGAFSYYNAWDIYNASGAIETPFAPTFNQIPYPRHRERIDIGTNFQAVRGGVVPIQLRSTITGIDLIPAGIYGAVFARENYLPGSDPADQVCARLVGSNGAIVNVSAPDNAVGYTTLPPGIISQESNGFLDADGKVVGLTGWGALNQAPFVFDGNFCWFYVFDTRKLFGDSSAFRPQFVQPLTSNYQDNDRTGFFLGGITRPYRNFYSVPFTTLLGYYIQSAHPTYPPKFSVPPKPADLTGFPAQFLPTGQFIYPYAA